MFKLFDRPWSVRLDIGNVTNTAGLTLTPDYAATSQLRRNYTLTVASDL
jgi:hypothetical protein